MKKLFGLIIITLIVIGCTTALATDEISFRQDGLINEKVVVIDSSTETSELDLIVAAYSGDAFVSVKKVDLELSAGENIVTTGIDWSDLSYDRVRFFVWGNTPAPCAVSAELFRTEGVVTATSYTNIADGIDSDTATVGIITANVGNTDVGQYLGKSVTAYYSEIDGEKIFTKVTENADNSVLTIKAMQLSESGEKYWDTTGMIGYSEIGKSTTLGIELEQNASLYVNYRKCDFDCTTASLASYITGGGRVELISYDEDAAIECILLTAFDGEAVIKSVKNTSGAYTYTYYSGTLPSIGSDNPVYKDGKTVTVSELEANDVVTYAKVSDDVYVIYASSDRLNGRVYSYDEEESIAEIGDAVYVISSYIEPNISDISRAGEGIFFINAFDEISYFTTVPAGDRNYALVTSAYEYTEGLASGYKMQVVLADGSVEEYILNNSASVVDSNESTVVSPYNLSALVKYFTDQMSGTDKNGNKVLTAGDIKASSNLVVRLEINSSTGKITRIKLLPKNTSAVSDLASKYDASSKSLGSIIFDDTTVVFRVKQTGNEIIVPEDVETGKVKNFFKNGINGYNVVAFDENIVYGAAVVIGTAEVIDVSSNMFVVTGKKQTIIEGEEAYVLTGVIGGEEVDITVYVDDCPVDPLEIKEGDVFNYDKFAVTIY